MSMSPMRMGSCKVLHFRDFSNSYACSGWSRWSWGCPIPGSIHSQAGWGFEWSGLEAVWIKFPLNPNILWFYDNNLWNMFFVSLNRRRNIQLCGIQWLCGPPFGLPKWSLHDCSTTDLLFCLRESENIFGKSRPSALL